MSASGVVVVVVVVGRRAHVWRRCHACTPGPVALGVAAPPACSHAPDALLQHSLQPARPRPCNPASSLPLPLQAIPRITSKGVMCGAVYKVASQADVRHVAH